MSSAQQDIAQEIQKAEEDGIDDQETAARINRIFASKKIRVKQLDNKLAASSAAAEECYSKCVDMSEMRSKYKKSEAKLQKKPEEITCELKEDNVTLEQAKRLIQKVKNRK